MIQVFLLIVFLTVVVVFIYISSNQRKWRIDEANRLYDLNVEINCIKDFIKNNPKYYDGDLPTYNLQVRFIDAIAEDAFRDIHVMRSIEFKMKKRISEESNSPMLPLEREM